MLRGRAVEMGAADDALSRAAHAGEGGVLLVLGPPGIGKTALLDALVADAAARGFGIGRSKADEGDQGAPMAPLLRALRSGKEPPLSDAAFPDLTPPRDHPLWSTDRNIGRLDARARPSPVLAFRDAAQWAGRRRLSSAQ